MAREILPDDPIIVREIHCEADRHITEEIILDCFSENLRGWVEHIGGVAYIVKLLLEAEIERTVYVFSESDMLHGGKIEETLDPRRLKDFYIDADDEEVEPDESVKLWLGKARWFSYQFFKSSFNFEKWMEEHDGKLDGWVICQERKEALRHLEKLREEGRIGEKLHATMFERINLAIDDFDVDLDAQEFVFDFLTPVENKRMDRAGGLPDLIQLVAHFATACAWRPFEMYKAEQERKTAHGRLHEMTPLSELKPLTSPFDGFL